MWRRVYRVHANNGPLNHTTLDWNITLHFTATVGLQESKDRFEQELDALAHVESWTEVHGEAIHEC